jgi:hypothetical protein
VPGAGLLRDGQKLLIPYALCLVLCAAVGAERLADRLPRPRDRMVLVGLILLPVVVLPDLALGGAGRMRPVRYPDDWRTVERLVAADPGPVLSLPLTMYRSYGWNRGTVVIDPLPRYLRAEVITDDTLIVGNLVIAGENERVRRIRALLASDSPVVTSGVRWVVVQHASQGALPAGSLAGLQKVHSGGDLSLYRNPAVTPDARPSATRRWIALLGGVLALVVLGVAIGALLRRPTAW